MQRRNHHSFLKRHGGCTQAYLVTLIALIALVIAFNLAFVSSEPAVDSYTYIPATFVISSLQIVLGTVLICFVVKFRRESKARLEGIRQLPGGYPVDITFAILSRHKNYWVEERRVTMNKSILMALIVGSLAFQVIFLNDHELHSSTQEMIKSTIFDSDSAVHAYASMWIVSDVLLSLLFFTHNPLHIICAYRPEDDDDKHYRKVVRWQNWASAICLFLIGLEIFDTIYVVFFFNHVLTPKDSLTTLLYTVMAEFHVHLTICLIDVFQTLQHKYIDDINQECQEVVRGDRPHDVEQQNEGQNEDDQGGNDPPQHQGVPIGQGNPLNNPGQIQSPANANVPNMPPIPHEQGHAGRVQIQRAFFRRRNGWPWWINHNKLWCIQALLLPMFILIVAAGMVAIFVLVTKIEATSPWYTMPCHVFNIMFCIGMLIRQRNIEAEEGKREQQNERREQQNERRERHRPFARVEVVILLICFLGYQLKKFGNIFVYANDGKVLHAVSQGSSVFNAFFQLLLLIRLSESTTFARTKHLPELSRMWRKLWVKKKFVSVVALMILINAYLWAMDVYSNSCHTAFAMTGGKNMNDTIECLKNGDYSENEHNTVYGGMWGVVATIVDPLAEEFRFLSAAFLYLFAFVTVFNTVLRPPA